jgi:hypothetical protein
LKVHFCAPLDSTFKAVTELIRFLLAQKSQNFRKNLLMPWIDLQPEKVDGLTASKALVRFDLAVSSI